MKLSDTGLSNTQVDLVRRFYGLKENPVPDQEYLSLTDQLDELLNSDVPEVGKAFAVLAAFTGAQMSVTRTWQFHSRFRNSVQKHVVDPNVTAVFGLIETCCNPTVRMEPGTMVSVSFVGPRTRFIHPETKKEVEALENLRSDNPFYDARVITFQELNADGETVDQRHQSWFVTGSSTMVEVTSQPQKVTETERLSPMTGELVGTPVDIRTVAPGSLVRYYGMPTDPDVHHYLPGGNTLYTLIAVKRTQMSESYWHERVTCVSDKGEVYDWDTDRYSSVALMELLCRTAFTTVE